MNLKPCPVCLNRQLSRWFDDQKTTLIYCGVCGPHVTMVRAICDGEDKSLEMAESLWNGLFRSEMKS